MYVIRVIKVKARLYCTTNLIYYLATRLLNRAHNKNCFFVILKANRGAGKEDVSVRLGVDWLVNGTLVSWLTVSFDEIALIVYKFRT